MAALALSALPAAADISFTDVTLPAGVQDSGETFCAGVLDSDGDGYPEIFSNKHQYTPTRFFHNQSDPGAPGGRGFSEEAENVLLDQDDSFIGTYFWIPDTHGFDVADWDLDGDPDILEVTGAGDEFPVWENNGGGIFEYRATELGLEYPSDWAFGGRPPIGGRNALFFDYNDTLGSNPPSPDGRVDVMVVSRDNHPAYRTPTAIFREVNPVGDPFFTGDPSFEIDQSTGLVNDPADGPYDGVACESAGMGDFNGDQVLDLICSDASRLSYIFDVTQLPFGDLRPIVGDEIFNRWPADYALGDFDNDLDTDIMSPTFAGGEQTRVTTVDSRTLHAWFNSSVEYNTGFNFTASGNVTFELDWFEEPDEVFIGASGAHPALAEDLAIMPIQGLGHGDPHHLLFTRSATQAAGIMTANPNQRRGLYIGNVSGQWQVRVSDMDSWFIGLRIQAQNSISNLQAVGNIPVGQMNFGNALLFLQAPDHELVLTPVQQINRSCISAGAADFDNDGDLDVYFNCSGELFNLGNLVYENLGNATFVAHESPEGQASYGRGESTVVADYDRDGCVDVYLTNGHHFRPFNYAGQHQLLRNNCNNPNNHWIEIRLRGLGVGYTNPEGIGATVYAFTQNGPTQMREQDGGKHKKAKDDDVMHFGLGPNQLVDLEVHWPSGIVDYFAGLAADQVVQLEEGTGGGGPAFTLSVADPPSVLEGPPGQQVVFNVNLSPAPAQGEQVDVNFQTVDGSAQAGSDYAATFGLRTFGEGVIEQMVTVPILDDADPEATESFTLQLTSANTNPATATATIQDDDNGGADCGAPDYDAAVDRAVFIWYDCEDETQYHLRITGGGNAQYLNHSGTIVADQAFGPISGVSLEASDVLNISPDGQQIAFSLIVGGIYEDGIDLTLPAGASACFTLNSPTDVPVRTGPNGDLTADAQVGIPGLQPCDAGGGSDCGTPSYDSAVDRAAIIWNDCGTDQYHIRITGGGNAQYVSHTGSIVSSQAFGPISGVSLEASDELDTSQADQILYDLIVGGIYEDGIDFTLAAGASGCFELTSPLPADVPIRTGASGDEVLDGQVGILPDQQGFGACQ